MADLDPAAADGIRILLSATAGAIAGGVVGEWRARSAEKRAVAREDGAEARADEREAKLFRRDQMLRAIDATERDLQGSLDSRTRRAITGEVVAAEHVPHSNMYLVGDEGVLRQYADLTEEFDARPPGSGFSDHDLARTAALTGHIRARLDVQRDRVGHGRGPVWPSPAFVNELLARAGDKYGVPEEFRPQVNLDAPSEPEL
jgi:hypothetical protein